MPLEIAIIIIVAIIAISTISRERIRSRALRGQDEPPQVGFRPPAREADLEREVADLRKRLEVLGVSGARRL